MTEAPICILCRTSDTTLVQVGVRHAPQLQVQRCNQCGLVFLWPHPSSPDSADYYTQEYRAEYGDPPAGQQYRFDLEEARSRVSRLLPFISEKTQLLDIGSGSGAFLDSVRPYCGDVTGVEPHEEYRNTAISKLDIRVVDQVDKVIGEKFDIVTMFHVLEHIEDPVTFLRKVASVMQVGSLIAIEVPNIEDMLVSVYQIPAYLDFYYQKAHTCYFSKLTLARVLEQAGFSATIEGTQRYDLSNHIRWMLAGQPSGQGYYNDILSPTVNAAYADALIRAGRSDTLWSISRLAS